MVTTKVRNGEENISRVVTLNDRTMVKTNLGILATLLISVVGGTFYLTDILGTVRVLNTTMIEVKAEVSELRKEMTNSDRSQEARITTLEAENRALKEEVRALKGR